MNYNITKLEKLFDSVARHKTAATVFSDILDFFLAPFRWEKDGAALQAVYERLTSHPNRQGYTAFLEEIGAQSEGYQDALGEFYMNCISHGRLGQYFTPEPVTKTMAQVTIGNDTRAGQRVLDPACGSGRMLLAAADINRDLLLFGADLDLMCCKMCVANMLMNTLVGEVAHMNSLSNEFFRGYTLRHRPTETGNLPYFIEFTDPNESQIWLRLPTKESDSQPPELPTPPAKGKKKRGKDDTSQGSLF